MHSDSDNAVTTCTYTGTPQSTRTVMWKVSVSFLHIVLSKSVVYRLSSCTVYTVSRPQYILVAAVQSILSSVLTIFQWYAHYFVAVQNLPRPKDATKTSRPAMLQQQTPASGSKRTRVQYTAAAAATQPVLGAADKPPLAIANGGVSNVDEHMYSNSTSASARRASRSSRDAELSSMKQHAASSSSGSTAVTPGDSGIRRSSFHKHTAAALTATAAPTASPMPAGQASDATYHDALYSR
jgi:hypothetical protein